MRVALLFGGRSGEHEISVMSAGSVYKALLQGGFEVVSIGITRDGHWVCLQEPDRFFTQPHPEVTQDVGSSCYILPDPLRRGIWVNGGTGGIESSRGIAGVGSAGGSPGGRAGAGVTQINVDVVFPVLHGLFGEDGTIQGLLDLSGMPYVGPGTLASAVCMDKDTAKMVLARHGVPYVPSLTVERWMWRKQREAVLGRLAAEIEFPVFVKPSGSGSSLGVYKVRDRDALPVALDNAFLYDVKALIEPSQEGCIEVECSVLGNDEPKASVAGQIVPSREFYDYEAKYMDEGTRLIIPAPLDKRLMEKVRELAVAAFRATGCSGLARVDFFVKPETGEVYVNELNTMPGFTKVSMYPKLWEASGKPYAELVRDLIELALDRKKATERHVYRTVEM